MIDAIAEKDALSEASMATEIGIVIPRVCIIEQLGGAIGRRPEELVLEVFDAHVKIALIRVPTRCLVPLWHRYHVAI